MFLDLTEVPGIVRRGRTLLFKIQIDTFPCRQGCIGFLQQLQMQSLQRRSRRPEFCRRSRTLQGNDQPSRFCQRCSQFQKDRQSGHSPAANRIKRIAVSCRELFRALRADFQVFQMQGFLHGFQKPAAFFQRFHQRDTDLRPCDFHRNARKPCSGAHIRQRMDIQPGKRQDGIQIVLFPDLFRVGDRGQVHFPVPLDQKVCICTKLLHLGIIQEDAVFGAGSPEFVFGH